MKNFRLYSLSLFLCLFIITGINGQSLYFKTIPLIKGHESINIPCIFQDSRGNLWFSTSKGLIRYNGIESYIFGLKDSISNSPITSISEDSLQQIWIGHKDGTIEFLGEHYFKKFNPEEGLSSSEISFIKFDSKGVMWFGTLGEGLYFYKGENRKRLYNISTDEGLTDNYVYCFAEDSGKNIYAGTDIGINIINLNSSTVSGSITMKNGLPDNIVRDLEISGNKLWIGMDEKGISIFDIAGQKFYNISEWNYGTLTGFDIKTPYECWAGTKTNGIIKIVSKKNSLSVVTQYTSLNGLPSDKAETIFIDREKNIWGSCSGSIFFVGNNAFEFIDKKSENFDYGNVFSFIADDRGNYWAATQHGLIYLTKGTDGRFQYKKILSALDKVQNAFISLYRDSKGFIWAGTYGYGVFRINPDNFSFKSYNVNNGLPDNNILNISGKGNHVWLATAGGGAVMFDLANSSFKTILANNYLYSSFTDSKGNTWFASDGKGAAVLMHNGKLINKFIPDSLKINSIYAITEDLYGRIWFLTSENGLLVFNGKTWQFYNELNGLISNNIRSIISDKSGNIILVSNEGIQIYLSKEAGFETYNEEKGVAYLEPNLNGISIDPSGNIWISESQGVIKFNPEIAGNQQVKPLISISSKMLFFNPFAKNKNRFRYNENHFTFEYNGIWFQSVENLKYRYKLEDFDFNWAPPTHLNSVTYSNLPPGKYTFKVEVSYKPGQWVSSKNAEYSFYIKPPFYKTWIFITSCVIAIIALILYYIKARTAKLLKAKEELELEVKKRTHTIFQQNEELKAQRDEIETQRDYVIAQRDQISLQNENITAGIQYASKIQQAMFPSEEEMELRLLNYFVLNRPMAIVSGDFYYLTARNNLIYLVVADCTGHGVPGAFMSVLGISLLNKIIKSNETISAAGILNELRNEVKYSLRQTGRYGEAQDGMDIAILIYNKNTLDYQFAGANNPLFIVRNGELIIINADSMPIGIYPDEHPFNNNTGKLENGDMIYLFSDGYADQLNGVTSKKFKSVNFKALITKISSLPLDKQKEQLNEVMDDWKAGVKQNDDILILGINIRKI